MKLTDAFQNYLQGEINACVAGHDARIERLSQIVEDHRDFHGALHARVSKLDNRIDSLCVHIDADLGKINKVDARCDVLMRICQEQEEMLKATQGINAQLEGTLRVMQKQIDKLEKTSTDQFDKYLLGAFDRHMRKYAKYNGIEDLMDPNELWDLVREYVAGEIVEQLGNIKLTVSTS